MGVWINRIRIELRSEQDVYALLQVSPSSSEHPSPAAKLALQTLKPAPLTVTR